MRKINVLVLMALFCLIVSTGVYGATCGVNPTEHCFVNGNLVVDHSQSPYLLNDTAGLGAMVINASNVIVDFNESNLIGNNTGIAILFVTGKNNITLQNLNISILNYTYSIKVNTSNQPDFTSVSATIRNITYDYSSSAKRFTLDCQGAGSIALTNLNLLKGTRGTYTVYHDGVFQQYSSTNTYTVSSCSTWLFLTTEGHRSNLTATESFLLFLAGWMIVFGAIYTLWGEGSIWGMVIIIIGATIGAIIIAAVL